MVCTKGGALVLAGMMWGALLAGLLAMGGCRASQAERAYKHDEVRMYLGERGLKPDASVSCWSDQSGKTVFIVAYRDVAEGDRGPFLLVLSEDSEEPLLVDLRNVSFKETWVDARGKIWELPGFARAATIDRASGLFIRCEPPGYREFSVGRFDRPDSWLFSGVLPEGVGRRIHVEARGDNIVVCEDWNFKVQGAPSPRAHRWVYSPDPAEPGKYVQTDAYWQDTWRLKMSDEVWLRVDGDWLDRRLSARGKQ